MSWLQRLNRIRWSIVLLFFFNILFISTGIVFSVYYYQNNVKFDHQHNSTLQANEHTVNLLNQLQQLMVAEKSPDKIAQAEWMVALRNHPQYDKESFLQLAFQRFNEEPAKDFFKNYADDFRWESMQLVQKNLAGLSLMQRKSKNLHTLLITCILTSLILGIGIPLFLFYLAGKTARYGYKMTRDSVKDWTLEWKQGLQSHGQDPFKNPLFWTKIGIVTVEVASRHHSHPAMIVINDLLHIVREELHQSPPPTPPTGSDDSSSNVKEFKSGN